MERLGGPVAGTYFTALEGSLRVPFIIRWPGKIPAGRVSNEIMHEMDVFPTHAAMAGGTVPTDRAMDGLDQSDFLGGKQEKSRREGFVIYVGNDIYGVKWQNWKTTTREVETGTSVIKEFSIAPGGLPFDERIVECATCCAFCATSRSSTCSAEDLAVRKAFANPERDWLDVESVAIRQAGRLDWGIIEQELSYSHCCCLF